ncbi:MAG TPA: hypothetical protein VF092_30795 [Longimicrobium sp.]
MKRTDLLLCGMAALLAVPVYRGPFRHRSGPEPFPADRLDARLTQSIVGTTITLPHEGAARGEDGFDGRDLSGYSAYSDGDATWELQGGWLVATGPADQSVLVRHGVELADGWVQTLSDCADDGGLVLRFRDASDYYLLAFRDDAAPAPRGEKNLAIYHVLRGEYRELWSGNVLWPRGTPHTIAFQAAGPVLRAVFDGKVAGEVTPAAAENDPRPYHGWGRVGLRHYGENAAWVTRFAAFRWHDDAEPLTLATPRAHRR